MFLQAVVVRNIVIAVDRFKIGTRRLAMLWLVSYQYLLRVPSEALKLCRGEPGYTSPAGASGMIYLDDDGVLCMKLKSRKNRPEGSLLRRSCSCRAHPQMCVVHELWWSYMEQHELGAQPWADITPSAARDELRRTLAALDVRLCGLQVHAHTSPLFCMQVKDPLLYGTHDLRRGHALDLQQSGAPLANILAMGEWKSRAVVKYLDLTELEHDVALEAAMHSDQEEWIG